MDQLQYVSAAYVIAFLVMTAIALKIWLDGNSYRRRVEALVRIRSKQSPRNR
ncbi:heme exporter protein CcmD [Rhizobium paranaense]|uniref:Heme exporter protein D n=1 Tax=Rhizobium paranaense TaxID=1650438 RepID=A0A7W8XWC3_9HYPH|nr:heme exporter protein CcmD [Rhizobium paranaense]MBB5576564.1 hypothetical protein [Rhizobium paranaense]